MKGWLRYPTTVKQLRQGTGGGSSRTRAGQGQGVQLAVQRVQVRHLLIATIFGINPGEPRVQVRTVSPSPNAVLFSGLAPGVKVAANGFVAHMATTRKPPGQNRNTTRIRMPGIKFRQYASGKDQAPGTSGAH